MTMPAPKTLTRAQYIGTAAGKRDHNYTSYLAYIAKARAKGIAAASADPFAQTSEAAIQQRIRSVVGKLPQPLDQAQIQSRATGMLDPVVQRITQGYEQQGKNAASTIGGYSNFLANDLATSAPAGVQNAYAPAEQATAASNAALADRLRDSGSATADDLAKRLASIGDPSVAQTTDAVRQNAGGASNASFANGTASLEQLIGNHATASDYASKLPGLARLSGVQQIGQATGAINKNLGDSLTQTYGQLPGIVQALQSMSDTRSSNRASLESDLYQALTGQNVSKGVAKANFTGDINTQTNENARTQAQINAQNARTQAQIDAANGRAQLAANTKKSAKKAPPKLSAGQVQSYKGTATTIAENAANGFIAVSKTPEYKSTTPGDPNGYSELNSDGKTYSNHHPALGWSAAYDEMLKAGVPEALAKQALKRYYGDHDPATNKSVAGPPIPKRK